MGSSWKEASPLIPIWILEDVAADSPSCCLRLERDLDLDVRLALVARWVTLGSSWEKPSNLNTLGMSVPSKLGLASPSVPGLLAEGAWVAAEGSTPMVSF